jgi:hypothetical protein
VGRVAVCCSPDRSAVQCRFRCLRRRRWTWRAQSTPANTSNVVRDLQRMIRRPVHTGCGTCTSGRADRAQRSRPVGTQ